MVLDNLSSSVTDDVLEPKSFPAWVSLAIGGTYKHELPGFLKKAGCVLGEVAKDMLAQKSYTTLTQKVWVRLARCFIGDLDLKSTEPMLSDVMQCVKDRGGVMCRPETAMYLAAKLCDAGEETHIVVLTDPIKTFDRRPHIPTLHQRVNGVMEVNGRTALCTSLINQDTVIVFALPD